MERVRHKVLKVKLMLHKWLEVPQIKKLLPRKLLLSKEEELLELMEKLNYQRKT